jgi:hypothetical protein
MSIKTCGNGGGDKNSKGRGQKFKREGKFKVELGNKY